MLRWIEGKSFASHLSECDSAQAFSILQSVANLLNELHGQGITHGDLHAGNVLLELDGKIWLTDFRPAVKESTEAELQQRIQADWDAYERIRPSRHES